MKNKNGIAELQLKIIEAFKEREWGQFHSPKNLSMDIAVEAAEIMEHFLWITEKESENLSSEKLAEVKDEVGDVFIALLTLADKLGIDLLEAGCDKLEKLKEKYPVELCKGKNLKHAEYSKKRRLCS